MINLPKLEKQNLQKCNKALISVVNLALLCYIQSKHSNLFQRVIGHYAFSTKISKRFIKIFYQMGIIVLSESIQHGLKANIKAIIKKIVEKTRFHYFFILYDNIDFYEHI